jgi:hypothetical protein
VPWLITTPAWPALATHLAGATARVVVDPVAAMGATASVLTCAGALLLLLLSRARSRPLDRSR